MREKPQPQALPQAEQQAQPVSPPRVLPFQLQMPALQEPQASVLQPQAPQVQPLDASAPLSPPLPSLLFPFWLWLLPRPPRQLLPEGVFSTFSFGGNIGGYGARAAPSFP